MTYCCQKISTKLVNYKNKETEDHVILYEEIWRDFFAHCEKPTLPPEENDWLSEISYCPFCGTKLPSSLADKWFDVLEEEYGITDPQNTEYDKVPPEFRTGKWWKKRGL